MNKLLCITSLGLLLLTGCHQAHVSEPMPKEVMANDPDAQIEFWHRLTDQPICSNDEAFHGLVRSNTGLPRCETMQESSVNLVTWIAELADHAKGWTPSVRISHESNLLAIPKNDPDHRHVADVGSQTR